MEINGISDLLYISQISYGRIDDLETVLQVNTVVKCMIIDHDKGTAALRCPPRPSSPSPAT